MIQSQSEKIVNVVDTNEQMPIVCQCIVKSGGNDDLKGKHGLGFLAGKGKVTVYRQTAAMLCRPAFFPGRGWRQII